MRSWAHAGEPIRLAGTSLPAQGRWQVASGRWLAWAAGCTSTAGGLARQAVVIGDVQAEQMADNWHRAVVSSGSSAQSHRGRRSVGIGWDHRWQRPAGARSGSSGRAAGGSEASTCWPPLPSSLTLGVLPCMAWRPQISSSQQQGIAPAASLRTPSSSDMPKWQQPQVGQAHPTERPRQSFRIKVVDLQALRLVAERYFRFLSR